MTLHFAATQALLDLDATPVLQGAGDIENLLPEDEYDKVAEVPQLDIQGLVIERIALENPDIILVPNMVDEDVVEQLREIAPVYIYMHGGKDRSDWQGRGDQIAEAMNLTTELDDVKAQLAERQEQISGEYADTLSEIRTAHIAAWNDSEFGIVGPDSMSGRILSPTGLQWDENTTALTRDIDGQELSQSTEEITATLGDADVIFYSSDLFGGTLPELDEVMVMPAFRDLPAVRDGEVYPLGKQTIAGYIDSFNVLDFLEDALREMQER